MAREITPRAQDYARWYQDVIAAAELAEHAEVVKGCMVIRPNGYALWERIQRALDDRIKATGHRNAYFPIFIPESFLRKEAQHVEGFAPECAVVTHGGGKALEEALVLRPTSETIMGHFFAKWIQSWRDLPLLLNQWANVVRWEMRPRLFLRTTEFLWQEGHTLHTTADEAEQETLRMLEVYREFCETEMAISVIPGLKTEKERFAGAERTYCIEGMMQDGRALQAGTSHNLGQNFARVFEVKYQDADEQEQFPHGTSWGVSTRLIGALIMSHSDDKGLVVPPRMAPVETVIVPVWNSPEDRERVLAAAGELARDLGQRQIRTHIDDRDNLRPGAKYYEWEKRGVPLRLEIGPRDLAAGSAVAVRRDDGAKSKVPLAGAAEATGELLQAVQADLLARNQAMRQERTATCRTFEELAAQVESGFAWAGWCGRRECEDLLAERARASIRCLPFEPLGEALQTCVLCGGPRQADAVMARAY